MAGQLMNGGGSAPCQHGSRVTNFKYSRGNLCRLHLVLKIRPHEKTPVIHLYDLRNIGLVGTDEG